MVARVLLPLVAVSFLAGCAPASTTTTTTPVTSTTPSTTTVPSTTTTPISGQLGPPVGPVVNHAVDPSCGTELWAKKTLQDPGSASVDVTPVPVTSVAQLNQVSDQGAGTDQRVGIELHVYEFTGQLVRAKLEGDSDYHVVMQDSSGATLVTEYPAPQCAKDAATSAAQQIDSARQAFAQACGPLDATSFKQLHGTATILGVGFYDRAHGQSGADNLGDGNDVELHPVIAFHGSC